MIAEKSDWEVVLQTPRPTLVEAAIEILSRAGITCRVVADESTWRLSDLHSRDWLVQVGSRDHSLARRLVGQRAIDAMASQIAAEGRSSALAAGPGGTIFAPRAPDPVPATGPAPAPPRKTVATQPLAQPPTYPPAAEPPTAMPLSPAPPSEAPQPVAPQPLAAGPPPAANPPVQPVRTPQAVAPPERLASPLHPGTVHPGMPSAASAGAARPVREPPPPMATDPAPSGSGALAAGPLPPPETPRHAAPPRNPAGRDAPWDALCGGKDAGRRHRSR